MIHTLRRQIARQARFLSYTRSLNARRPYLLADVGEGIKECEVIQWMVEPGARVEEFDPICELQSDKATVEITSRYAGTIEKLHFEVGQMAQVGEPLLDIDVAGEEELTDPTPSEISIPQTAAEVQADVDEISVHVLENKLASQLSDQATSSAGQGRSSGANASDLRSLATPAVRRICKELNVAVNEVVGTGKGGRVLKEDVSRHAESGAGSFRTRADSGVLDSGSVVPLKGVPKQMFKTMSVSSQIPHFLFTDEIEMDRLMAVRNRINRQLAPQGTKLSYMPFFIKALSLSLSQFPLVNSRLLVEEQALQMRPHHNVSVAIDTPYGLVVPNVKSVESKSILEVASDLTRLQEAAQAGKLQQSDFLDGTITLSNIGTVGGTYVAPVLVDGQVAIGGMGAIRKLPRFDENDNVVPRNILCTSWSGDHRALDGATLARLVCSWKQLIENPEDMLLQMH